MRALRRQGREHLEIRLHAGLAGAHAPPFLLRGRTDLHDALAAGSATAAGCVRLKARVDLNLKEGGSLPRLCDSVLADKSDLILVHDGSHPEFVFSLIIPESTGFVNFIVEVAFPTSFSRFSLRERRHTSQ